MLMEKRPGIEGLSQEYVDSLTEMEYRWVAAGECPVRRCVFRTNDIQHPAEEICIEEYSKEKGVNPPASTSKCLKRAFAEYAASKKVLI